MEEKLTYKGVNIEEMSREELLEALKVMYEYLTQIKRDHEMTLTMYEALVSSKNKHITECPDSVTS